MTSHAVGWPMPRGGAQSLSNSLAACLRDLGGKIETNARVRHLSELPSAPAILLDITPWQLPRIAGERLPVLYYRRLEHFQQAPGVFKIDYALDSPVPWEADECRHAGTVHLGGTLEEIAFAEREVAAGDTPERPFVLVAQQSVCDRTRRQRATTRFGRIATFPTARSSTWQDASSCKSSDSPTAFAHASWHVTSWVLPILRNQMRI
jgi:phytoene dehydrogenase-like protein